MRSPRFNASSLFQRSGSRDGEAFAEHMADRKLPPLEFWRKKLRTASSAARDHAFDSAGDHEEALKHLQRMQNHIEVRGGTPEFDPIYMAKCFAAVLQAMGSTEDDAEDESDLDDDSTAEERYRAATGEDDLGEVPARSVVRTSSREIDHRKDFNSTKQGGADSAYGFDADELFQRSER